MVPPRKRSVSIRGHRTSFSVEDAFFEEVQQIARQKGQTVAQLVAEIDAARPEGVNLSSAIRLRVLAELKRQE
jgi:predicted DNA-binding ribbon-helix-helix protein